MKTLIAAAAILALAAPAHAQQQNRVGGYWRSDGTYVQPHARTNPDGNPYNNWSTQGNFNPYTGQQGTQAPVPPVYQWRPIQNPAIKQPRQPSPPRCPAGSFLC